MPAAFVDQQDSCWPHHTPKTRLQKRAQPSLPRTTPLHHPLPLRHPPLFLRHALVSGQPPGLSVHRLPTLNGSVVVMNFEVPAHTAKNTGKPAGRIRQKNEEAILAAAEEEFARHGFKGTSMNTIAQTVGLPKANLHYYFSNKLGLYLAVLSNILELWDSTFNNLTAEDDPAE